MCLFITLSITSNINLMALTNSLLDFFITETDVYTFEHAVLYKTVNLLEVGIKMKKGKQRIPSRLCLSDSVNVFMLVEDFSF